VRHKGEISLSAQTGILGTSIPSVRESCRENHVCASVYVCAQNERQKTLNTVDEIGQIVCLCEQEQSICFILDILHLFIFYYLYVYYIFIYIYDLYIYLYLF
jgi:hypothetical protein